MGGFKVQSPWRMAQGSASLAVLNVAALAAAFAAAFAKAFAAAFAAARATAFAQ